MEVQDLKSASWGAVLVVTFVSVMVSFSLLFVEINSPEVQAYIIPMDERLQRSLLGGTKLVNKLLHNGLRVYWLAESSRTEIANGSAYSLKSGDFIIPARQKTEKYGTISSTFLSSYLKKVSLELNTTYFETHHPFEAAAYPLTNSKVAVYYGKSVTGGALEHIYPLEAADFDLDIITETDIQQGRLADYDVITFPGGHYYLNQSNVLKVKDFVQGGGGFLGTCGGAFFGAQNGLLNVQLATVNESIAYASLRGPLVMESKAPDHPITFGYGELLKSIYFWGPFIDGVGKDVEVVATYNSSTKDLVMYAPEIVRAYFTPQVEVINSFWGTPAIIAGTHGNGKVVLSGVHPESLPEAHRLFINCVYFLSSSGPVKFKSSLSYIAGATSANRGSLMMWNETLNLQITTLTRTLRDRSLTAREVLNGLETANRETIGLSGEYLELYLTDVHSRSLRLLTASSRLESSYTSLEELKDDLVKRMSLLHTFSDVQGESLIQIENLQREISSLLGSMTKLEELVSLIDAIKSDLLDEMEYLRQILVLDTESSERCEMVYELQGMESSTLSDLKDNVDSHLIRWSFKTESLLTETDFLIFLYGDG